MSNKPVTGTLYQTRDGFVSARLSLTRTVKISVPLGRKPDDSAVRAALPVIAAYARRMWATGDWTRHTLTAVFSDAAKRMAELPVERYVKKWKDASDQDTLSKFKPLVPSGHTFEDVARLWTSGAIHAEYAGVPLNSNAERDLGMLVKHVFEHVGAVPIGQVTPKHFSKVYHQMGEKGLRDETRVFIWKVMARVMQLAYQPLGLITSNPIERGSKPKVLDARRTPMLLPVHDDMLMACPSVDVLERLLYGFLGREGMRIGEAIKLRWVDVMPQLLSAFCSKTGKETARVWDVRTRLALLRYRELYAPESLDTDLVFEGLSPKRCALFRAALKRAGVFRVSPELAMHSRERGERRQVRPHDLRRLFVTLSIAQERSDAWIRARTGHTSSRMIVHYNDLAEQHKQLGRVELAALDCAIPELRDPSTRQCETAAE